MNPGTASGRLLKNILFNFISKENNLCHRCNKPLTRDTFSIEHIEPWLDKPNAKELFFNLENISYSHLKCNIANARKPYKRIYSTKQRYKENADRGRDKWNKMSIEERKAQRRARYIKYGK